MSSKKELILDCGVSVLKNEGYQEFSMRRVAAEAGISLGNLQYHFKTKEILIENILDCYIKDYTKKLNEESISFKTGSRSELDKLIEYIFTYGDDSECGIIFREIWAISNQNEVILKSLGNYYDSLFELLVSWFSNFDRSNSKKKVELAASLIMPLIEGHTLTQDHIPLNNKKLSKYYSELVWNTLE